MFQLPQINPVAPMWSQCMWVRAIGVDSRHSRRQELTDHAIPASTSMWPPSPHCTKAAGW